MITSAVRGMNYLKPRCEKFFFCPAGVSLFTEDTVRVLMQKAKENENDHEKSLCTCLGRTKRTSDPDGSQYDRSVCFL